MYQLQCGCALLLVALLLRSALALTVAVNINCLQMPYNQLINCCQFPVIDFQSYMTKCAQPFSQSQLFDPKRFIQPCVIACIFQKHGLIDADNNLQLSRLRKALHDVFEDKCFAAAFFNGFSACVPSIRAKLERRRKRDKTKQSPKSHPNCSDVPMLYAVCAHTEVFIHCPEGAWQASRACNATREFVRNCIQRRFNLKQIQFMMDYDEKAVFV